MCIAVPGKVLKIEGQQATVKFPGVIQKALVSDMDINIGDFVMVQMGIIIKTVTKSEAEESYKFWEEQ